MDLKVTITGQTQLLDGLARANQLFAAEQRATMLQATQLVQAEARQLVKKDTRRLAQSIRPFLIESRDSLIGIVEPFESYGLPVERGRRPGQRVPPFQPLMLWGQRHGFITLRQVQSLRWKIARRGIDWPGGAPFMLPAYRNTRARVIDLFARIGQTVVTRIVRGTT